MTLLLQDINNLKSSLLFLHMQELRDICLQLKISDKGTKGILIERIVHFLKTGKEIKQLPVPLISCAQKKKEYPLEPKTLILKGSYKNDLQTRLFFKKLIGEHFHFTAFGIDWINDRWMQSNPPTYQEYADMWQKEYARRKEEGSTPKEEWAYINFIQKYVVIHPQASRQEGLDAWEKERMKHKKRVSELLRKRSKKDEIC